VALEREDPRCARIVTLRYFGGLTEAETAACVGVSESTVVREWRYARSWLYRAITGSDPGAPGAPRTPNHDDDAG